MLIRICLSLLVGLHCLLGHASAQSNSKTDSSNKADVAAIREALQKWVVAFNSKDLQGTMAPWAQEAILSYPGSPDVGIEKLREGYTSGFARTDRTATYELEIEEVQVSADMAFVRDSWTLIVKRKDNPEPARLKQRSIEIWRRQPDKSWKIIRSLSYPENTEPPKAKTGS